MSTRTGRPAATSVSSARSGKRFPMSLGRLLPFLAPAPLVGGQAVMEGVMMRNGDIYALAVRTADGNISVENRPWFSLTRSELLKKPFLRGFPTLIETLVNGIKALNLSAERSTEGTGEELKDWQLVLTLIVSLLFAVGLFVVVVIAMILGGLYVIIANVPTASGIRASFANWFTIDGGFLPHGLMSRNADGTWTGLMMALVVVMFSFGGTELIGITAGETENPRTTIPKATNGIIWRILVFYIVALGVIMAVVPWSKIDGDSSPFVQIFDSVGVHAAAGILNFVCLTAVMSVYNSGLYANSRMLYSLARQGNAPAYLGKLSKRGVPVGGVITSAIIIAIAVVVVFVWPEFAFNYLMSIATIAAAINWIMIMVTEIKFRRMVAAGDGPAELKGLKGKEALDKIAFKLPFANVTPYVVIAFMLLVVVLMCFSASYRIAVIAGVIWLAVLFAAAQLALGKSGSERGEDAAVIVDAAAATAE